MALDALIEVRAIAKVPVLPGPNARALLIQNLATTQGVKVWVRDGNSLKAVTPGTEPFVIFTEKLKGFGKKIGDELTNIKDGVVNAGEEVNEAIRSLFQKLTK